MDVYISTVARWPASSCTDSYADGSTFVSRKATMSGFATNQTRTFLANALKADKIIGAYKISLYDQLNFIL